MPDDIPALTAADMAAAFAARSLSPVEVARTLIARIERLDPKVNAFCLRAGETALAEAAASEARWRAGAPLSPIDGVPVAVKDLLLTRGWPTLRGSLTIDPAGPWEEDAPCVARLREAGSVLIGKTTTPEYGWRGTTESPLTGVTRNPWDLARTPGGSSGGAGAALAARFCPLALGTDGGGSIRIPAAFSGVFGLKPQYGRVPAFPLSPFGTVAHVGPMARTVRDAALMLDEIARPDARDWQCLPAEPLRFADRLSDGLRGRRVAFSPRLGWVSRIDPEIEAGVRDAAGRLEALGAHVEAVDPPGGDMTAVWWTLWSAGGWQLMKRRPAAGFDRLDPGFREMVEAGSRLSLSEYLDATQARGDYASAMRRFMERWDFIVTPALATPAFEVGRLSPFDGEGGPWTHWSPFAAPFNLTQQPAASVPCGFTASGLPIGLQIVGRSYADADVLAAAAAYEAADPCFERAPPGF